MNTRYIVRLGIVLVLCLGGDIVSGDTSPGLIVEKFDCSGFDIRMINAEPDFTYHITLRGEVENAGGFLWWPTAVRNDEYHAEMWPDEWVWCWLNWDDCWRYGIFLPEPEFIYWSIDLTAGGWDALATEYVDMSIPCGYQTYLPLAVKNYSGKTILHIPMIQPTEPDETSPIVWYYPEEKLEGTDG